MTPPIVLLALAFAAPPPPAELAEFVRKPDPAFAWKRLGRTDTPAGTVHDLALTSQTWQGVRWEHGLQVFVPAGAKPTATFVLWNQGVTPNPFSTILGVTLAGKVKAPVVFLYGVPNQPLLGGKREDALIAETFVRYLETGDADWPLLFPMVKSVTAAMTAAQQFAAEEWDGHRVEHFVVTGASKRGWTAWLTAATGDPRVKAIAPLVIDFLNFPEQMANQVRAFGKPSEMIRDYTDRGLVPIPDTPRAKRLWAMVDPYVYRDKLGLPKLIVNGTNDPYWPLDALNSYWDDLPGEKYLLYVPNAGHNLSERVDEAGHVNRERVIGTLAAFCRCQVFGTTMPKLTWAFGDKPDAVVLTGSAQPRPIHVRDWGAEADSRDFRKARWANPGAALNTGTVRETATPFDTWAFPSAKFLAFFVEAEFELDGLPVYLSTQIRILEPRK